jgi:hypothetical protein
MDLLQGRELNDDMRFLNDPLLNKLARKRGVLTGEGVRVLESSGIGRALAKFESYGESKNSRNYNNLPR